MTPNLSKFQKMVFTVITAALSFVMSSNNKARQRVYKDETRTEPPWKSDINITVHSGSQSGGHDTYDESICSSNFKGSSSIDSYYKKYEHDVTPVKEDSQMVKAGFQDVEAGDSDKVSLTNSQLEKLEKKIFSTISQELQTDNSSVSTLESNIKFFKTTVLEIFDNFYASMKDFEIYKKRFNDILAKNREDAVADMESFIKDMINHIISSDSNITHEGQRDNSTTSIKDKGDASKSNPGNMAQTAKLLESLHSVVESYKNDHFQTDSTFDDTPSKFNSSAKKEEIFNIYLLNGAPCVQIKMNNRHLLSEINIKDPSREQKGFNVASADNLKKLADKKQELEEYGKQQEKSLAPDREIPVKISYAKKNIYLDEDFNQQREKEENKSFISKICNFICKKLRRG